MSVKEMVEAVERYRNSRHVPEVSGFDEKQFDEIRHCMEMAADRPGRKLLLRNGLHEDGTFGLWWQVKVGDKTVGAGDTSFNCPPRPPEDCVA